MFSERFFRNYNWILTAALIALLIPIVWGMFYVRPVLDDLGQPLQVAYEWRETGSVWKTFLAALRETGMVYQSFSGVFLSYFLSILPLSIFQTEWLTVHMLLILALYLSALLRSASLVRAACGEKARDAAACFALLLTIMVLLFMPNYCQTIFWFCGAVNYTVVFALFGHLFISLIQSCLKRSASIWRTVVLCIGFFCVGGGNWLMPAASIVAGGAVAVWIVRTGRPKRYLLPLLCLVMGYLTAAAAPGNTARQELMDVSVPIMQAGIQAMIKAAQFGFSNGMHYLFLLLFLPVGWEIARHFRFERGYPLWLPLLSMCVLGAHIFPLMYQSSYWDQRHTNACFQLLCVLLSVNAVVLIAWLTKRFAGNRLFFSGKRMTFLAMAVVLAIGLISVKDADWSRRKLNCSLQPATLVMNLLDGSIQRYAQEYDELTAYVAAHAGEDIVIPFFDIPTNEMVGPHMGMFSDNPTEWRNTGFAGWWGGEGTTIIYEYDPQ